MTAAKQNIQDLRMPFRNMKKSCVEINAFTVFCVCSSNYSKKILLTNPFDSPFYELLTLLIFASFFDFLPSLSLKESLPWEFPVSRVVTWRDTSFLGTQALPGKDWKMATTKGTKYGVFRNNILLSYERCCRRYMSNIIDSSALIFLSLASFFLSMVNVRRHFDWKCHRQLLVTHLWKILLSWLQFYAVERANCKKLQR